MSIVAAIKSKNIELRKARDPLASILSSVLNLANLSAKDRALKASTEIEVIDADAIAALRKTMKQCDDMIDIAPSDSIQYQQAVSERTLLASLMPSETSDDDVKQAIVMLMANEDDYSMKQMGKIMAHLTQKFGTALNKASASTLIKNYLATMNS